MVKKASHAFTTICGNLDDLASQDSGQIALLGFAKETYQSPLLIVRKQRNVKIVVPRVVKGEQGLESVWPREIAAGNAVAPVVCPDNGARSSVVVSWRIIGRIVN